jgi:hypothetical protein
LYTLTDRHTDTSHILIELVGDLVHHVVRQTDRVKRCVPVFQPVGGGDIVHVHSDLVHHVARDGLRLALPATSTDLIKVQEHDACTVSIKKGQQFPKIHRDITVNCL